MRSAVFRAVAPAYTVRTPGAAYESVVAVVVLASEGTPSLKLWVVLGILHIACVTDADRQSVAAEE